MIRFLSHPWLLVIQKILNVIIILYRLHFLKYRNV